MARSNQTNKKRRRKKGQGKKETENEERNTIFQSVWQWLLRLLLCLLAAAVSGVRIISWIPWVSVQLFFRLVWVMLLCEQLGLYLLAWAVSVCLQWLLVVLPWTVWFFMLIEGVHLGCSIIRLIILAVLFVMPEWVVRKVKNTWPLRMLRLLQGEWSSTGSPAAVANIEEQHVDNGQHGLAADPAAVTNLAEQYVDNGQHGPAVDLKSVGDYLDQHPPTMSHPTYQFQIPTREGLTLWQGFLDIVLNAYEGNKSWAGTFTEEHLRMSGSKCSIEMEPSYLATFDNLLLDLAQLAALLLVYFETPNLMAPRCIQQLYSAMTTPWLGPIPAPTAQQLANFVKFMRNHPSLKPARKSSTFLTKVFQARRGMGVIEKAIIDAIIQRVILPIDWMDHIVGLGYAILTRTVLYRKYNPLNTVPVYKSGAEEFFRFLRNVFEHGGDLDANGRQMLQDMEDLDYIAAEEFSDEITLLIWHLVMDMDMTGILSHAWADYQ